MYGVFYHFSLIEISLEQQTIHTRNKQIQIYIEKCMVLCRSKFNICEIISGKKKKEK